MRISPTTPRPSHATPIVAAFAKVTSFDNLRRAAVRAARGKRQAASAARFFFALEPNLLTLQRQLQDGSWRPGKAFLFEIRDPKHRVISAAPFVDRVVHHAVIDPIEPALDAWLIDASFACRRGKGQHRALAHAQAMLRRHAWFLKMDVQSFFPSLRHDVVLEAVGEAIEDPDLLSLIGRIVRQPAGIDTGLPIGNLTSQWLANITLSRMDRWLTSTGVVGYTRYMDDFVVFGESKAQLRERHCAIVDWLALHGLQLKARATILAPASQGLPFLGFRVYRRFVRLRPENLRRTKQRLQTRQRQFARGVIDESQLADCTRSVLAHLDHGNTIALRRSWFAALTHTATDRFSLQPLQPRRELQQPRSECAVGQPQQQRTLDPQQQPGPPPRQDVPLPDRAHRHPACARRAT